MIADYHVHTLFSDDSEYPMEDCIRHGIELGIEEICFTEHVDYGVKTDLNCDLEAYYREFLRCQKLFQGEISLKFGVEAGVQTHTMARYEQDCRDYPFDFVILSCHQVDNKEFWNQCFQAGKTQEEIWRYYYGEILNVVQSYRYYSVLGHLDMLKRYDPFGEYSFSRTRETVEAILKTVIRDGKGIEVNTSSFRYGLTDLMPSTDILTMYRELGGQILTFGSDSHAREHLGAQIGAVQAQVKELGFRKFHRFTSMVPEAVLL